MTLLPSQKLTIGEFLVSLAAGLMLYLLPNDAKNQFESEVVCIGFVFVTSIVITAVMYLIIKRYEALGTALVTFSSLCIINLTISVISGIITKGTKYWPKLTEYNIICMFILWVVPFLFGITMRLLTGQAADTNDSRRKFIRFMSLSMNSLLMIYGIVLILRMIIPTAPNMQGERIISVEPLAYLTECLQGSEKGIGIDMEQHNTCTLDILFICPYTAFQNHPWHNSRINTRCRIRRTSISFQYGSGIS